MELNPTNLLCIVGLLTALVLFMLVIKIELLNTKVNKLSQEVKKLKEIETNRGKVKLFEKS